MPPSPIFGRKSCVPKFRMRLNELNANVRVSIVGGLEVGDHAIFLLPAPAVLELETLARMDFHTQQ